MTIVSVVECVSPVSLRSCGSSVSSLLQNRKRLQNKSSNKRGSSSTQYCQDCRNNGLESTLVSSPISSPVPRSTVSNYRGPSSGYTVTKSASSSDEFCDDKLDKEIAEAQERTSSNLLVIGSKPRLHGMWEVAQSQSVSLSKDQPSEPTITQSTGDIFETIDEGDRESCVSPENPPPSPINFASSIDSLIIGGQKLVCPERCNSRSTMNNRDFKPGFYKQPEHHCVKCEGRVMEEELSQVTLHRRLNSILSSHGSRQCYNEPGCCTETKPLQTELTDQSSSEVFSHILINAHEKSFYETYTKKKRMKEEKERKLKEDREKRKEGYRICKAEKVNEKLTRKEEKRQKANSIVGSGQTVNKPPLISMDSEVKDEEFAEKDCSSSSTNQDLRLPPICWNRSLSAHSARAKTEERAHLEHLAFVNERTPATSEEKKKNADFNIRRSLSDASVSHLEVLVDSKQNENSKNESGEIRISTAQNGTKIPLSACLSSCSQYNEKSNSVSIDLTSCPSLTVSTFEHMSTSTEVNSELKQSAVGTTEEGCNDVSVSEHADTMSSTLIVPDREIPCTQWVSFTGDNEPVLNTSPEVDDSCDTFLRRLQRSKLYTQNDPSLPTGQQFCFEAMVDKRYNRWKRRRRKKQSEAKRANVVHASDSSDENDERTEAMERIIDRMYEEIHGPVPQTPNGSRDTPRVRNRRRRRDINSLRKTPDDDVQEQDSSVSLYDASSEWQSDVSLQSSSSVQQIESTAAGEQKVLQNSPSKSASDDLCSWPYLEHYKSEILKRLQSTPPDHLEDLEQNDWLPNIDDMNYDSEEGGDVGCEDTDNICSLDFSNADDVKQNENTFECQDICKEITSIATEDSAAELTPDEYEPYICITETPCQSPVQESIGNQQHKAIQTKVKCPVDVSEQVYPCSYTKWSRSQTSETKKICSFESKPKPLSRTSTPSCSLIYCDPDTRENNRDTTKSTRDTRENIRDTRENTIDIIENTSDTRENTRNTKENTRGTRENKRDPSENTRDTRDNTRDTRENRSTDKIPFRQIKQPEFVQRSKERQAKKSKKVALNINKQIVNLPSLTKTSRSQTIPRPSTKGSFESTDRSLKVKVKPTKSFEESHRTQSTLQVTQTKGSLKGSQTVPDLTLKDYYLRTLYGYKTRINSHVDDSNKHKGLKKTLTVDNLELLGKRTRKKSEMAKPNDLAFTRSFTFSMFDLPEVYKLYNTNLERTATGEEIEIQL